MAPITSIYGLGLGKMTIKSALDQPFIAEIELIDVGSVAIKDVRVNVADPENFEQIGLERAADLSLLSFKIEKNEQGKEIIKVESVERMSEPYMELVVDLTWPEGQLYKAYTILLDPPGYHLVSSTIQGGASHYKYRSQPISEPGIIDQTVVTTVNHNPIATKDNRKKATYGPTVTNESLWQIAQRYKSSDVILPQVVLAIVGANPDAFNEGNLNGLKVGVRLTIPASSDIALVPADLATAEVMAHDKAWNDKKPIEHVLTPPYMNNNQGTTAKTTSSSSSSGMTVTPIPTPSTIPQLIPNTVNNSLTGNQPTVQNTKPQSIEQDFTTRTEISLTVAAVESVREANALLMEQLHLLQKQNDKLQKQLDKRNKELKQLRSQVQVLVKQRQSLPSQASAAGSDNSSNLWPLILLLLAAGGGIGFAYWYLRIRKQQDTVPAPAVSPSNQLLDMNTSFIKPREVPNNTQVVVETEDTSKSELMVIEPQQTENKADDSSGEKIVEEKTKEELREESPISDNEKNSHVIDDDHEYDISAQSEKKKSSTTAPIEDKEEDLAFEPEFTPEQPSDLGENNVVKEEGKKESFLDFTSDFDSEKVEPQGAFDEGTNSSSEKEASKEDYLEFESGLHNTLNVPPTDSTEKKERDTSEGIDFDLSENESETTEEPHVDNFFVEKKPSKKDKIKKEEKPIEVDDSISQFFVEDKAPNEEEEFESSIEAELKKDRLKSKKALETLLALAKTYMSMDDFESARHSLEEVVEHGSKKQKEEATSLLESIKGK